MRNVIGARRRRRRRERVAREREGTRCHNFTGLSIAARMPILAADGASAVVT